MAQITTPLLLGGEFPAMRRISFKQLESFSLAHLLRVWLLTRNLQLCISFRKSGTYFLENISVFHFQPISHYLILAIHLGQVTLGILLLQKTFQLTYKSMTSPSGSNKAVKCWMTQCQYFLDYTFLLPR